MPVKSGYYQGEWVMDQNNATWTLEENGQIYSELETGIRNNSINSTINVLGWIRSDGADATSKGLWLGANADVEIGENGWISGFAQGVNMGSASHVTNKGVVDGTFFALLVANGGGSFDNQGILQGGLTAVTFGSNFTLTNTGDIRGFSGVGIHVSGEDNTITNGAGASIAGRVGGILISNGADAIIHNEGTIRTVEASVIECIQTGTIDLTNRGTIIGNITLGSGGNTVDTRGGVITGKIIGGAGDDLYKISSTKIIIDDLGPSTNDVVWSSVDYTLVGGLDDLLLKGKKAIDGTGNVGHNGLFGNVGRNRLEGDDGNDLLDGGRGNDVLDGGDGADVFRFRKGYGVDVVLDFEDGIDLIGLNPGLKIKDIRQSGDNTIVDFGHGDMLKLLGIDESDISSSDILREL